MPEEPLHAHVAQTRRSPRRTLRKARLLQAPLEGGVRENASRRSGRTSAHRSALGFLPTVGPETFCFRPHCRGSIHLVLSALWQSSSLSFSTFQSPGEFIGFFACSLIDNACMPSPLTMGLPDESFRRASYRYADGTRGSPLQSTAPLLSKTRSHPRSIRNKSQNLLSAHARAVRKRGRPPTPSVPASLSDDPTARH